MTNKELIQRQVNGIVEKSAILKGFYNYLGDVSITTVRTYLNNVKRFLSEIGKTVSELEFDDYSGYMSSIKNFTSSHQITVYAALKRFSKYLFVSGKSKEDYMSNIARPKPIESIKTREKREKGYLTEREVEYLIDNIKNGEGKKRIKEVDTWSKRDLAIVLVLLNTGMRCSALTSLNVENIDLENNSIRTVEKGSKIRDYYITDSTVEAINDWLEVRKKYKKEGENALFVSRHGLRLGNNGIADIVDKYSDFDGKSISPHKLRATFGTRMFEKTGDLYFVQQCMGHSNPITTELYIRGQEKAIKSKAKQILENLY